MDKRELNEQQKEIYQGLISIGPEIAAFFLDGIQMIDSDFRTKSNLLGHIMREIDGGLRDIFEYKQKKKSLEKELSNDELKSVFNKLEDFYNGTDYLSDITFNEFKDSKGHISSIIASLGLDIQHPLAVQYIKVVRWLSKYAHRRGAYNEPRTPNDIIKLWYEFEDLLLKLIGNYYSIADRIILLPILCTEIPAS